MCIKHSFLVKNKANQQFRNNTEIHIHEIQLLKCFIEIYMLITEHLLVSVASKRNQVHTKFWDHTLGHFYFFSLYPCNIQSNIQYTL